MRLYIILTGIVCTIVLSSCFSTTRVEKDVFTITKIDTTIVERINNAPGERENGTIFPTTRTMEITRTIVQSDSVVTREYPNFIRLGLFEGVGLIGSAYDGAHSKGTGLFGLFPDLDDLIEGRPKHQTRLFSGGMYRIGIGEWRLRWFGDHTGWSWGVNAAQLIMPDDSSKHDMLAFSVFTVHKRFYLKRTIPYISITPQVDVSLIGPARYINLATSADVGSIAGLNLRLYAGLVYGSPNSNAASGMFPYLGVGTSVLDFLNREEELETEWKYHEHSGWEIGLAEVALLGSSAEISTFSRTSKPSEQPVLKGFMTKIANATVAIPILDHRLSFGTSLINIVAPGDIAFGLGVLPLRILYTWHPSSTPIQIVPFIEYNYAISQFFHLGAKVSIPIENDFNLQLVGGFVDGSTMSDSGISVGGSRNNPTSFSMLYFGFGASFFDRLFGREDLRYGKGYPHE